jgi:methionyl-tRNA formyltransferase
MSQRKLNIILLGKKSWSAKALEYLINKGHNILAVVGKDPTEELDASKGSLLEVARKNGILTINIEQLYNWIEKPNDSPINIKSIDLVISYLFWKRIKKPLLSLPNICAINFHPAPLPDYKGLGGYNAAILDGRTNYGVTAHIMNEKIDEGFIIKKRMFEIDIDYETALSLEKKSQKEMYELFKEVIDDLGKINSLSKLQMNSVDEGIYINRDQFEMMKIILPSDTQEVIDRKIRAFWFPPYEGAKVKIGEKYYTLIDSKILNELKNSLH